MKLFKITLILIFMGLCTLTATAQKNADQVAKMQTRQIAMICDLSPEQQKNVFAANKKMVETRQGLKGKENKEARKEAKKAYRTELKTILTPEQYEKWKASKDRDKKPSNN